MTAPDARPDTRRTIDAVWRIESARLIAGLARFTGDIGVAEELAQDALVVALEKWPNDGVPDKPGAWLMATAKNRAIDLARRDSRFAAKLEELGRDFEPRRSAGDDDIVDALDNEIGDDLPRLVFTTCHPILSQEARVALTLRLLGGLTTDEIARAFLVSESTIAQGTNSIYPRASVYSQGTRAAGRPVANSAIPSASRCPSTLSRSPT